MEASEKEYICSLEKDNGMHRCGLLPPTKFNKIECTATIEDYLNYTKEILGNNDFKSNSALIGSPSLNHEISLFLTDNRPPDQLTTSDTNFLLSPSSFISPTTSYYTSVVNESMSSTDNFNTLFTLRDNQTQNCINWNKYYTKCKAGDKNPFQGK